MKVIVLVSANTEWEALKRVVGSLPVQSSPYGETFVKEIDSLSLTFFHAGWGKAASAGGMQYVCDHYHPDLVVNLGTCGGFAGAIEPGEVVLADRAFMYDIFELMEDNDSVQAYYTTDLDLNWLPDSLPHIVRRGTIASADSDLLPEKIPLLQASGAIVADWESAALAWVARKNGVRLLILRAVSDLVGAQGGEAYGDHDLYKERTQTIMHQLMAQLPDWLEAIRA